MKKENRITIRLTNIELKKLGNLANQTNLSKSEFIRILLDRFDENDLIKALVEKQEFYVSLKAKLNRIGININQIVRKLNTDKYLSDEDKFLLKMLIEEIKKIYEKLL